MYVTAFVVLMYDYNENNEASIEDWKLFDNSEDALEFIHKNNDFDCYRIEEHQIEIEE